MHSFVEVWVGPAPSRRNALFLLDVHVVEGPLAFPLTESFVLLVNVDYEFLHVGTGLFVLVLVFGTNAKVKWLVRF